MRQSDEEATGQPNPGGAGMIDVAVLDDDADFRQYVEDFLREEGRYTVRTFPSPEALHRSCAERAPEILLLDMKMGEHEGEQILAEVHAAYPGLCIIVVTGYPSLENMRRSFQLKVFDYLPKPFSLGQLRQTLANAATTFGLGRAVPEILRERLGHRIRVLRTERNWALKDLAAVTRLSVSQISSIERGAHLPSMESFLILAQAFEKKPSEILESIDF